MSQLNHVEISLENAPLDTFPAKTNNIPHFLIRPYIGNFMSFCDQIPSIYKSGKLVLGNPQNFYF